MNEQEHTSREEQTPELEKELKFGQELKRISQQSPEIPLFRTFHDETDANQAIPFLRAIQRQPVQEQQEKGRKETMRNNKEYGQKLTEYRKNIEFPLLRDLEKKGITTEQYSWLILYGEIVMGIHLYEDYPKFCKDDTDIPFMHAKKKAYEHLIQKIIELNHFKQTITESTEHAHHPEADNQLIAEAEAELEAEAKRLESLYEV